MLGLNNLDRSPFQGLFFLLSFCIGSILGYSFWPKAFRIGKWQIKKSEAASWFSSSRLQPTQNTSRSLHNGAQFFTRPRSTIAYEYLTPDTSDISIIDTSKQRILLTGDSMTERLLFPLIHYCRYNQHEFLAVPIYSSTTQSLSQSDTLDKLITQFQPTIILLTLGSNELFIPKIKTERATYVEMILKKFKNRKFIWIGPPNWAKDTGINDLILEYVGKGRFFDSRNLTLARDRDGAHPTFAAGKIWADTLARWVMHHSKYKIRLRKPPYL
ncbi:MAG: SGNH/GDSL hydrolase family protein [Bacteroidia bacterium]|nr:SGNH/GDSL hydrolase family protein [Bacteroidia bacterium]MDW8159621.1 SGNH/GDSL hydrolase family protein [Bacteroidia bacterium]